MREVRERAIGLITDIGGTNARFALADARGRLLARADLATADYADAESAIAAFLAEHAAGAGVEAAVIAIAAPVAGPRVRMTNGRWVVDAPALAARFGWRRFRLLNDFAAIAYGLPALEADGRLVPIGTRLPPPDPGAPRIVMGPGTGLGLAVLAGLDGDPLVIATEAGHVAFAPEDAREWTLAERLARRHGRVSIERLLSGPGLITLYRHLGGTRAQDPAEVAAAALAGADPQAMEAARWFLDILARFAGDMVLAHGAWAGVAFTGGVFTGLRPLLQADRWRALFAAEGRYRALIERVPVFAIAHADPGLFGAAKLLGRLLGAHAEKETSS